MFLLKNLWQSIATQLSAISKQLKANSQSAYSLSVSTEDSPLSPNLFPLSSHIATNLSTPITESMLAIIPLNHWTQDESLGGGRIIGEACHFIDLITFLVGAPPVSVTAHALPNNGKYREDNVSMTFTFPDGSIGVVDYLANGDKSFPKERLEVFCEGMIAVLDDYVSLTTGERWKEERRKNVAG